MLLPQVSWAEEGTAGWGVSGTDEYLGGVVILSGSGSLSAYVSKTVNNAVS